MLKVDLGELRRKRRLPIDIDVPPASLRWEEDGVRLTGPLHLEGNVQESGADVVLRGRLKGEAETSCRRCLAPIRQPIDEEVVFVYRPGLAPVDAESSEVYTIEPKAREIDLTDAVREHVVLAAPQYVICDEACRGLCPKCGANLNEGACACHEETEDARWAALKRLSHE
jgi:uncharacterized protein